MAGRDRHPPEEPAVEPVEEAPEQTPAPEAPEEPAAPSEPVVAAAVIEAEAVIIKWGDENGHEGIGLAALRNFAPHELLQAYDDAVAAEAAKEEPPAEEPSED